MSFSGGEEKQRRKRMKIFGEDLAKNCQGCWKVSIISVSVSRLLPIFGEIRFPFRKICFWKKVSDLVLENLVSEKSIGFGEFGLGKKVSVSEKMVSDKNSRIRKILYQKKSPYRFRSKFWYRHSVILGHILNFPDPHSRPGQFCMAQNGLCRCPVHGTTCFVFNSHLWRAF